MVEELKASKKRKFFQKKRFLFPFVIILSFAFLSIFGAFYSSTYQKTSNVELDEFISQVSSQISAKVIKINYQNNSLVNKDDIIIKLEDNEYIEKISILKEENLIFNKELEEINNKISDLKIENFKKELDETKANFENATDDFTRYENALKDGIVTKKDFEKAQKNLKIAKENYEKNIKDYEIINKKFEEFSLQKNQIEINLKKNSDELKETEKELSKTEIKAFKKGKIEDLNIKVGDIVEANKPLFTIVSDEMFINAIFNKNEKTSFKTGQNATIKIYSTEFKKLNGEISEILSQNEKTIKIKVKVLQKPQKLHLEEKSKVVVQIKTN